VDKALDKSSDVAAHMIDSTTGLISKLSDDIGIMADRVLTMEQRIGLMADRIVHTEKLMAKLTATLAGKELDVSLENLTPEPPSQPPLLDVPTTKVSEEQVPVLNMKGDPTDYLLYLSLAPFFPDGGTVVSRIKDAGDYPVAWKRGVEAISRSATHAAGESADLTKISVAVKTVSDAGDISPISNSIDVTVFPSQI